MARAPWLADVLRTAGLDVVEVDGWKARGREMETIYGVVGHDTVTPPSWSNSANVRMLRDGHSNLSGPLSQLGLDRDGRFYVVAAGRCHHNGYGTWGNDCIGIEVFANGGASPTEAWNRAQRDAVEAGARAILDRLGLGRSSFWNPRLAGHKETDPSRKVDPWGVDMGALRRQVAAKPTAKPQPDSEPDDVIPEDDMLRVWKGEDPTGHHGWWLVQFRVTDDGDKGLYTPIQRDELDVWKDRGERDDIPDVKLSGNEAAPSWFAGLKRV